MHLKERSLYEAEKLRVVKTCMQPGCPVGLENLVVLEMPLHDASGTSHLGTLIVHSELSREIARIFDEILRAAYPIARMIPVHCFDGNDEASMQANNSSCFNGRKVKGTERWSLHAYGRAIDLNPLTNPWVYEGKVYPAGGISYLDRSIPMRHSEMLFEKSPVVQVFLKFGWEWGGNWETLGPDYHHFQKPFRSDDAEF